MLAGYVGCRSLTKFVLAVLMASCHKDRKLLKFGICPVAERAEVEMFRISENIVYKMNRYFFRTLSRTRFAWGQWIDHLAQNTFLFSIFREAYIPEDNTTLTLYTDDNNIFPQYERRVNPNSTRRMEVVKVSLIATAYNEAQSIDAWMESIFRQTRSPDEIIIVDSGSTDDTYQKLISWQERSSIPFRVYHTARGNIAQGRNTAIQYASHPIIAVTDFGVRAHSDWLARLVAPFEIEPRTEFSGGWYCGVSSEHRSQQRTIWRYNRNDDPRLILSPGVSMAFTRIAWEKAGGFPEWLTMTGEDTYFNLEIKRSVRSAAFVPQALVDWELPETIPDLWKKFARWSFGDGEAGLHNRYYLYAFLQLLWTSVSFALTILLILSGMYLDRPVYIWAGLIVAAAWVIILLIRAVVRKYSIEESLLQLGNAMAMSLGFLAGARHRMKASQIRLNTVRGIVFVLAGVPIDDTGGGSRFAQLAQEMIRQQFAVVYIYAFPKGESIDLDIRIRHPNLFHDYLRYFSLDKFLNRYHLALSQDKIAALVEIPLLNVIPILKEFKHRAIPIVYELVDDWETSLGGEWYNKEVESNIAQMASIHTATVPVLADRLERLCSRPVTILPNAANLRLFNPDRRFDRPKDYPGSQQSLIYIGALYGTWFDWDLLVLCAQTYPDLAVVVIGDYQGQYANPPHNLYFLGLKRHMDLPVYLAAADVAIIPWKVNEITLATSPLKIYEYLAMEKLVVVPALPELKSIPGIFFSQNDNEFLQNIRRALVARIDEGEIREFLSTNSWEYRVAQLWGIIQKPNETGS